MPFAFQSVMSFNGVFRATPIRSLAPDPPRTASERDRALAEAFKALPRPFVMDGRERKDLLNHWNFSLHNVPCPSGSEYQFLVLVRPGFYHRSMDEPILNPESVLLDPSESFIYAYAGALPLRAGASPRKVAAIITPIMLEAFVSAMDKRFYVRNIHGIPEAVPRAPWTWSTGNPDLAVAVGKELQKRGIRDQRGVVGTSRWDEGCEAQRLSSEIVEILKACSKAGEEERERLRRGNEDEGGKVAEGEQGGGTAGQESGKGKQMQYPWLRRA